MNYIDTTERVNKILQEKEILFDLVSDNDRSSVLLINSKLEKLDNELSSLLNMLEEYEELSVLEMELNNELFIFNLN